MDKDFIYAREVEKRFREKLTQNAIESQLVGVEADDGAQCDLGESNSVDNFSQSGEYKSFDIQGLDLSLNDFRWEWRGAIWRWWRVWVG